MTTSPLIAATPPAPSPEVPAASQSSVYASEAISVTLVNDNPVISAPASPAARLDTGVIAGAGSDFTQVSVLNTGVGALVGTTSATATQSRTFNGQDNVLQSNYRVTSSTDPRVGPAAGTFVVSNYAPVVRLTYTEFGAWSVNANATSIANSQGVFAGAKPGGDRTPEAAMPRTGSASFAGGATGYLGQTSGTAADVANGPFFGAINLTADFAANAITGAVTGITVYRRGADNRTVIGTANDILLTATIARAGFSGTATAGTAPGSSFNLAGAAGGVAGAFFGPAANETAGTFSLSGGPQGAFVVGSFGAKRP